MFKFMNPLILRNCIQKCRSISVEFKQDAVAFSIRDGKNTRKANSQLVLYSQRVQLSLVFLWGPVEVNMAVVK